MKKVSCMIGREVERFKVIVIGLDIGAPGDFKAHPREDVDHFIHDPCDRMDVSALKAAPRQGDIGGFLPQDPLFFLYLGLLGPSLEPLLQLLSQLV